MTKAMSRLAWGATAALALAVAAPAAAYDATSPADVSRPGADASPADAPRAPVPAYASGGVPGAPPGAAPAAIVTPDDGYAPEDTRVMHRRHQHRRHRPAD